MQNKGGMEGGVTLAGAGSGGDGRAAARRHGIVPTAQASSPGACPRASRGGGGGLRQQGRPAALVGHAWSARLLLEAAEQVWNQARHNHDERAEHSAAGPRRRPRYQPARRSSPELPGSRVQQQPSCIVNTPAYAVLLAGM